MAITKMRFSASTLPSIIKVRNKLITCVNGFKFTATASQPVNVFAGNRAVLKKNTGNTIAFLAVS